MKTFNYFADYAKIHFNTIHKNLLFPLRQLQVLSQFGFLMLRRFQSSYVRSMTNKKFMILAFFYQEAILIAIWRDLGRMKSRREKNTEHWTVNEYLRKAIQNVKTTRVSVFDEIHKWFSLVTFRFPSAFRWLIIFLRLLARSWGQFFLLFRIC